MKYFTSSYITLKVFFFIGCALLCSLFSRAQSDQGHQFLYIHTSDGPDNANVVEETETPDEPKKDKPAPVRNIYKSVYADFGTSVMNGSGYGNSYIANGLTGALCGQVAYKIKSKDENNNVFVSAGLELRTINLSFPLADTVDKYGSNHDALHFWYIGVPVMLQLINTRHTPGNDNDVNFYIQAGITFSAKISVTESTDSRPGSVAVSSQNFNSLMLQPFLSAGLSYTTKRKVCLIGPFFAYNTNNISNQAGFTENLTCYGIRLTAGFFK